MIWLVWRQHRSETLVVGLALAFVATVLILTGLDMTHAFQQMGVAPCIADREPPNCNAIVDAFEEQFSPFINGVVFLNAIPVLLAMLVGAPLVARETEQGTQRLIWTQSLTRMRWIAGQLATIVGIALLPAFALAALLTWWFGPLGQFGGYFFPTMFDLEGIVPLAYMAFALALAVAAGALLRRTVPAMLVTVAGFLAVRVPVEFFVRPRYLPPLVAIEDVAVDTSQVKGADWVLDRSWLDQSGHTIAVNKVIDACNTSGDAFIQCIHAHGWLIKTTYQPAERLPLFAGIETAIFVSLAVALLGVTVWWVTRRLA